MIKDFNNAVVAITGAGSGIGRALAIRFAQENCHLALSDVHLDSVEETKKLIQSRPQFSHLNISCQKVDVSNQQQVFDWAKDTFETHGKVNLIINNAGVALSGTVNELEIKDYQWIMDINFWGVIYGTKAFLPYLEQSGEGHIVNISSVFGLTAQPFMSGYNASKYAVRGFTEALRQDLEISNSTISATCVHPGGIKTNIAKSARISDKLSKLTGKTAQDATKEFEMTFLTTSTKAADTIFKAVKENKRRVLIGPDSKLYDWSARLLPSSYQAIFTAVVRSRMKRK